MSSLGSAPIGGSTCDGCGSGLRVPHAGQIVTDAAFRKYARYVAATAHRVLGGWDEVEDVVQEVFLAALLGLARLRDENSTRAWLTVVTIRAATRRRKNRSFEPTVSLEDDACENLSGDAAHPEHCMRLASVQSRLNRLPAELRKPWILHCLEGVELAQVAASCGCSVATVRRRVAFVRAHLGRG